MGERGGEQDLSSVLKWGEGQSQSCCYRSSAVPVLMQGAWGGGSVPRSHRAALNAEETLKGKWEKCVLLQTGFNLLLEGSSEGLLRCWELVRHLAAPGIGRMGGMSISQCLGHAGAVLGKG